jgi:uncharacterized protein (DUF1330 family)
MRRSLALSSILIGLCIAVAAAVAAVITAGTAAQSEKKAYLIVQVDVTDAARYQEYGKHAPAIVAKFGGRYLARAGRTVTLEGAPAKPRVVVIEFPSLSSAQAFYDSREYLAARKLREGAGEAQFIVVEGVE